MASKAAGVSDATLINLIYRHLKENGHKKAANVLKKHTPQVKTAGGKVSLSDIFKKWMSNDGANSQMTCVGERHPSGNSVPKPKKSKKVSRSPDSKKKEKSQATDAVKKRTKTKKADATSLGDFSIAGLSDLASISQKTGEDSDSDSSLDVEKWKKLALDFSDADIAKMDALTSVETTAAPTVKTPARKGKPAQIKKGRSPTVKLKPSTTKKKDTVSDKLPKTKKLSKPGDKKSAVVLEQTPKKKKHTAKHSEPDEVEATGTEVANTLPEAVVAPETHASNSSSATAKKVKHKKADLHLSFLSNIESPSENALEPPTITPLPVCQMSFIPEQVDTMMSNGNLTVDQTKRYDALSDPGTPLAKKKKSKKSSKHEERVVLNTTQLETEAAIKQTKDQLKTPSKSAGAKELDDINPTEAKTPKKHKAKKYAEPVEPVEVATPSGGDQTEAFRCLSATDQSETPSKKNTKKAKSIVDVDPVETTSKKRKAKKTDLNGTETPAEETEDHSKKPSKKTKHQAANSLSETILETPKTAKLKKVTETDQIEASSKKVGVDVEEGMATESLPFETDNTKISTKKRKKKSATADDQEVASQIEPCQQGVNSAVDNENDLLTDPALEGTWLSSPKHEKGKKRRSEGEEDMHVAAVEDDAQEPRKRKKHKDKEKEKKEIDSAESVVPTPPPLEELLENKEKKKKKKKTSKDEEKPAVPTADPEAVVPKKTKKSKEKEHVTV